MLDQLGERAHRTRRVRRSDRVDGVEREAARDHGEPGKQSSGRSINPLLTVAHAREVVADALGYTPPRPSGSLLKPEGTGAGKPPGNTDGHHG
ncbi:hypothetical protein GCM10010121_097280 [Streptomyces brasiliensis]|uniref:Uncharacterized protein n=1 Tax=Streptomyces brasiliensis TaxID=1954 RepID=A0A917PCQ1_9ACTN|nr:hypothetical protein GCM10010121_097280 [Streptomyces brasiliensis]